MTLIMNKYDYQPISRKQVEGKRKYMTPDGNAVASVTTILDATSDKALLAAEGPREQAPLPVRAAEGRWRPSPGREP